VITYTLILGYIVMLLYALLRVAQDLLIRTVTLMRPLSDRDDHDSVRGANPLPSVAPTANRTIDEREMNESRQNLR
jgi:hypothetical protein